MARFSLKWLLAIVGLAAMWAAAFASANIWWLAIVTVFNAVALLYATLRVAFAGRGAPFWLGFALVGWAWIVTPLESPIPISTGQHHLLLWMVGLDYSGQPVPINQNDPRVVRLKAIHPIADSAVLFAVSVAGGVGAVLVARKTAKPHSPAA